ncbi:Faf-like [Thalictrum thalictroides]|uniref:Faf-like n=1 Tax=Thalictrum thalictroides TaxID=46969 RepID=A0A7J6X372_THATH|nr:Faf-like [Thalictrum thalictroides]
MIDKRSEQVKNKIFPPPISSLNQNNGHRKFYLKSERENGRLQITVKKINRPEILRASRQDGRLTLHLMEPVSQIESKEEAELKESEEELNGSNEELNGLKESERELNGLIESVVEEKVVDKKEKEIEVSANGGGGGRASDEIWKFLLGNGGGESHRRCYDLTHHHHHYRVPLWSNHYVLTG